MNSLSPGPLQKVSPGRAALVIVDVQNDFRHIGPWGADAEAQLIRVWSPPHLD